MSTNSHIGIYDSETQRVRFIYCHWDGYLEGVGAILQEHYTDLEKINKLLDLGDISILRPELEGDDTHCFENPNDGVTVSYKRDRKEQDTEAREMSRQDFVTYSQEFEYLWDIQENKWIVFNKGINIETGKFK